MKKYIILPFLLCFAFAFSACDIPIKLVEKAPMQETTEDMSKYGNIVSVDNVDSDTLITSDETTSMDTYNSNVSSQDLIPSNQSINSDVITSAFSSVSSMETPIAITAPTSETTLPVPVSTPIPIPQETTVPKQKGGIQIPVDRSKTVKYNNVLFIQMTQDVIALNDTDVMTGPGYPSSDNNYSIYGKIEKGTTFTISGISYTGWVCFSLGDNQTYFIYNSNLSPVN